MRDCLINVLPTKKVALIRDTFSRPFKSTKMAKFWYDYEIINCKSGILLDILFQRLLSKTKWKSTILVFLKNTFLNTFGHQYLIWCFYGIDTENYLLWNNALFCKLFSCITFLILKITFWNCVSSLLLTLVLFYKG